MTGTTEVVVIGGRYAGVTAANRLTRRAGVTVRPDQRPPRRRRWDGGSRGRPGEAGPGAETGMAGRRAVSGGVMRGSFGRVGCRLR